MLNAEDQIHEAPRHSRLILFLDDDPSRAQVFLAREPDAVWVETAAACIEKLSAAWDEVHLDHDLGGEVYVDIGRDDCGMEVVRNLCLQPRPHLRSARFVVHSHNPSASAIMVMNLNAAGYNVSARPFGMDVNEVVDHHIDDDASVTNPDDLEALRSRLDSKDVPHLVDDLSGWAKLWRGLRARLAPLLSRGEPNEQNHL